MTTTKDRLHHLVDELPEGEIAESAQQLLEQLLAYGNDPLARKLLSAPIDVESETDAERAAIAEAYEAIARGDVVSDDELRRELGL